MLRQSHPHLKAFLTEILAQQIAKFCIVVCYENGLCHATNTTNPKQEKL